MPLEYPYSQSDKSLVASLQALLIAQANTISANAALRQPEPVGPFYIGPNLAFAANTTTPGGIAYNFNDALQPYPTLYSGSVVGVSGFGSVQTGSTNFTAIAVINGAATSLNATGAVGTSSTVLRNTVAKGAIPYGAGDNLRIDFSNSTAASLNGVFWLYIVNDPI